MRAQIALASPLISPALGSPQAVQSGCPQREKAIPGPRGTFCIRTKGEFLGPANVSNQQTGQPQVGQRAG